MSSHTKKWCSFFLFAWLKILDLELLKMALGKNFLVQTLKKFTMIRKEIAHFYTLNEGQEVTVYIAQMLHRLKFLKLKN